MKRATISTENGVTGIPVGAEVKVLAPQEGSKIRVEYRGHPLILPASQLTNDLDLVASLTKQAAKPATPQATAPGTSTVKSPASEAELEAKREASVRGTRAKQFESAIPQAEPHIAERQIAVMDKSSGNSHKVAINIAARKNELQSNEIACKRAL